LAGSTKRHRRNTTETKRVCRVFEVLNVEQGERKNIRVIEKNSEKIRRANLPEHHHKLQARTSFDLEFRPIKLDEVLQNSPISRAPDSGDSE